jgi:hypothetical protein
MKFSSLSDTMQEIVVVRMIHTLQFLHRFDNKRPWTLNYISYVPSLDVFHIAGIIPMRPKKPYNYAVITFHDSSNYVYQLKQLSYKDFISYNEGVDTIILYATPESAYLGNHLDTAENVAYIKNKFNVY